MSLALKSANSGREERIVELLLQVTVFVINCEAIFVLCDG